MRGEKRNLNIICQRCKKNQISYYCYSCRKPFNSLCSECDTYVHSIIPYKKFHNRVKLDNFADNNINANNNYNILSISKSQNNLNFTLDTSKENNKINEKVFEVNATINKLNSEKIFLKENVIQLTEKNNLLMKEKDNYLKELEYLRNEMDRYMKENMSMRKEINDNNRIINDLKNNLNTVCDKLNDKEKEIEEIKYFFDNKISGNKGEKEYLLKVLDDSNLKLQERNDVSIQLKKENELLKQRLINFEQDNLDNLKLISQLQKENKELIRCINQLNK
jgi:hypothetical protein